MKKIILALFSIIMIATMLIGTIVFAGAEATDIIPVPELPAIDRPYKTIEELGIDYEEIDAYFPQNIETRYEGGKVYVEDFGASSVETFDSNGYGYVYLELIDGYWTAELSAAPTVLYVYSYESSTNDRYLNVTYHGDGHRDEYIRLDDSVIGVNISFSFEYGNVTVLYQSGNYCYEDRYEDGDLNTHGVSNREDEEITNQVLYGNDGRIRYCTLYTDGYYYYFPEQGWSSDWYNFVACDAPAGYENIDETYFTANKPSLICSEAKGDDIVHDMSTAYCAAPSTCKNGCGYTVGKIEHHDWQIVDGKKECSLCDLVFFPEFGFIDRTYNNLEESGFPYDEIKAVFPEVLTVKYEDGKYMVKDVGADKADVYNNVDYEDIELSLVDGWWICELDEEIYNDESINLFVYFEGEIDGIYWDITYTDGTANGELLLFSTRDDLGVSLHYDDYDRVISSYRVGDRLYNDEYKNGALDSQEASLYIGEDHVYVLYPAGGSFERAYIYIYDEWFYYYPDRGWERGVEALLTPPAGYENADVAYFESILPTTINCMHERFSEADCLNPERCLVCGIDKEGSAALGHDYDDGVITHTPTCMETGERLFTCLHDRSHTYTEEVEIDENAHAWDDGAVTTNPTCSAVGTRTFTCAHNGQHTYTEEVEIDENAHAWDDGTVTTNPTCSAVGTRTFTCAHNSEHTYTEEVEIDENAHAWDGGAVTTNPTCSAVGTRTFTCAHNGEHTYTEDVEIDENAHAWDGGAVTTNPTCSAVGTRTFICAHNSEHTKTENVNALGHTYDNACDATCNTCGEERIPAQHVDGDENNTCDVCGARIPKDGLSGGAVAGIATGSAAAAGLGGFSLFWFVIKKKKWSDLALIWRK